MSDTSVQQELAKLIAKAGEIQQGVVITNVTGSPGAVVVSGNQNRVTYTFQSEKLTQTYSQNVEGLLSDLRKQVDSHKTDISDVEDVVANIDAVERELKKEKPDGPKILGRVREIGQAVLGIASLATLATQLLEKVTSLFHPI